MIDLNALCIPTDYIPTSEPLADNSVQCGDVAVYFRDIERHLVRHISEANTIVGCVAWLTSKPILQALAGKHVAIVVQKEDFLRPDSGSRADVRRLYAALRCGWDRRDFGSILKDTSTCGDQSVGAVRCVGNHNRDKVISHPRMHNKFAVFCREERIAGQSGEYDWTIPVPYAVWTGSFNFSHAAGRSLENAVVLTGPSIVRAYFDEWAQIMALSEPLDWESEWCAPEWRLGT